jgi:uncharacterized membrane protein YhaH (DUF805 family)
MSTETHMGDYMNNIGSLFFSFSGRTNRAPWWIGLIVLAVISSVVSAICIGGAMADLSGVDSSDQAAIGAAMGRVLLPATIIGLVMLWPSLALYTKRWHDRNKSGWWTLIGLIPIIGGLWLLIELGFLRGTAGPNSYGPDPLQG